jgi:hypothetical protein
MGRPYTGAATVYSSPKLELSRLKAAGYFTKDAEVRGSWTWSNGDAVTITTVNKGAEVHMVLSYTWTDPWTGKPEDIHQRIDMVSKPSNLGRGKCSTSVAHPPGALPDPLPCLSCPHLPK